MAIEIKTGFSLSSHDMAGLIAFSEEFPKIKKIIITLDGHHCVKKNGIEVIPIFQFLPLLWNHEIF